MFVGANIAKARKKCGMSQEDLAKELLVSRQSVSLWENDQTAPTLDNLEAISKCLGVSIDYLFGREQGSIANEDAKEKSKRESRQMAKASLILAIINCFLFVVPVLNFMLSISSIIYAIISYKKNKNMKAVIAFVLSIVYFIASICVLCSMQYIYG